MTQWNWSDPHAMVDGQGPQYAPISVYSDFWAPGQPNSKGWNTV